MIPSINTYQSDNLLVATTALANNKIEKNTLEASERLRDVVDHPPLAKMPCDEIDFRITTAALSCNLGASQPPLAVISGAGIAGLAAAFELRARGFEVIIVEKRKNFSRFNVINLNIETQVFFKKFNLLEKFESFIAARIQKHRLVLVDKSKSTTELEPSDVRGLQLDESVSFEPENFNKLFDKDGIYSVPIGALQTFLAENALEADVEILFDEKVRILSRTQTGGVSEIQITADRTVKPDLFFIAEGTHSTTARELGMETKEVASACTGENWIFGNVPYFGKKTFVVSLIDASEKTLRIANVIFNAKNEVINIAVTSEREVSKDMIEEQILRIMHQVCDHIAFPINEEMARKSLTTVSKPVHIANRISSPFSMGNVFCIGDSAGSSSPLAGLGGTLGLTLAPRTVKQLLDDYEKQPESIHENFNKFSAGYTSRWIQKSESIKQFCINNFDKEHNSTLRGEQNGN